MSLFLTPPEPHVLTGGAAQQPSITEAMYPLLSSLAFHSPAVCSDVNTACTANTVRIAANLICRLILVRLLFCVLDHILGKKRK